jgi:mersacidin/lichenicidin family type 2 lantibiotic
MDIDKSTILHAWKDEDFKAGLAPEVRERIPPRPTNEDGSELSDEQLEQAAGGTTPACVGAVFASAAASATIANILD